MKRKFAAALVAVVIIALSLAALAFEKASSNGARVFWVRDLTFKPEPPYGPTEFLLKSGGRTIAELRVLAGTQFEVSSTTPSGHVAFNQATRTLAANEGAVLKVTAGTNSVTVRADEIETVPAVK